MKPALSGSFRVTPRTSSSFGRRAETRTHTPERRGISKETEAVDPDESRPAEGGAEQDEGRRQSGEEQKPLGYREPVLDDGRNGRALPEIMHG